MTDSGYSQQDPGDSASDFAARQFQINQTLARIRTMALVEVMAITGGAGAIAAPGTVNVKPLVKIIDGQGNVSSHGTIFNIPVNRLGGGDGAIICDPAVGEIGWMAVADRDSSVVIKTGAEGQPGSRRKFDMADGVYMGKLLGGVPAQYLVFNSNGMQWHDKNDNNIVSDTAGISINGVVFNRSGQVAGNLPVTGALELGGSIKALSGGVYGGDITITGKFFGVDFRIGSGGTLVSLSGHQHTANNSPPNPGH